LVARSIQGIPIEAIYLETLIRSLPKSKIDRNKNRKENGRNGSVQSDSWNAHLVTILLCKSETN